MTIKISDEVRAKAQADLDAFEAMPEADNRPRPFDPAPNGLKGCMLLAVRANPGAATYAVSMAGLRLFQQLPGRELAARSFSQLLKVLVDLEHNCWLPPFDSGGQAEAIMQPYIARQRPLPVFGVSVESTWTPLETPYWKPGDVPRLVLPARKKRRPSKAKPHTRYSSGKNVQVNP